MRPAFSRRGFLKSAVAACLGGVLSPATTIWSAPINAAGRSKIIGLQIGAVSFVDEGVEQVLETVQSRGGVNALFIAAFTYGRGLAGRQVPGQPFPDHGVRESDEKTFHGGNYATPHRQFYDKTILKETRAPDHGNLDILEAVLP